MEKDYNIQLEEYNNEFTVKMVMSNQSGFNSLSNIDSMWFRQSLNDVKMILELKFGEKNKFSDKIASLLLKCEDEVKIDQLHEAISIVKASIKKNQLKKYKKRINYNSSKKKEKVFISYVREDTDDVDIICNAFQNEGIDYWLDRNDIEPGKDWKESIREAIKSGSLFLACFSSFSTKRDVTHMNEEILQAIEMLRKKPFNSGWFIPIRLDDCQIPNIEFAPGKLLNDIQILDMFEDPGLAIERLVDFIKKKLGIVSKKTLKRNIPEDSEKLVLNYLSYKALIDRADGRYFHNADMGHPVYMAGADDKYMETWDYADGPDKNFLYKELSKVTKILKKRGIESEGWVWWYDFSSWKKFCQYVINAYRKKRGYDPLIF